MNCGKTFRNHSIDVAKAQMAAVLPQMPSAQAIGVQLGATPPGGEGNLLAPQTTTQQAVDALTFDWNESMVNK